MKKFFYIKTHNIQSNPFATKFISYNSKWGLYQNSWKLQFHRNMISQSSVFFLSYIQFTWISPPTYYFKLIFMVTVPSIISNLAPVIPKSLTMYQNTFSKKRDHFLPSAWFIMYVKEPSLDSRSRLQIWYT